MKHLWHRITHYTDRLRAKDGHGYARCLAQRGFFHAMGRDCYIDFSVNVDEPYLVSMGDNVWLTDDVRLLTHDGAISMLSRATGERLRKFGSIHFGNNVFVGMNASIMPGVTVGDNCIIATGSVVTRDIAPNTIVGGNPAKAIGTVEEYLGEWRCQQDAFSYTGSQDKEKTLVASLMGAAS